MDISTSQVQDSKSVHDEKTLASSPPEEQLNATDAGTNKGRVVDPLKWFGILVPPTLRSSQQSFKGAVRDIIPTLANVMMEMKETEIEVRRTRKKLGKALREKS